MFFDPVALVKGAGYLGVTSIIFAESGLFFGFFLPGESLLFTAGFLASQGTLDIRILVPCVFIAAVLGDSVGYTFGKRIGPKIFNREDSLLFHRSHLERARSFYERHGGKAIIIARFMPVIRTFAPIVAGVGQMRYIRFLAYNVAGALLWAAGASLLGYWLGNTVPNADKYMVSIVVAILVASVAPSMFQLLRTKESRAQVAHAIKTIWRHAGLFFSRKVR